MRQNSIDFKEYRINYQVGNADLLQEMQTVPAMEPFSDTTIEFLNTVSRALLADREAKNYADVVTLAFWIRRASVESLKKRFVDEDDQNYRIGRGVVFHIAPSNVPVNYAYSLVTGLLCGNANIVRISSKDFPQTDIINRAINQALKKYSAMVPYIAVLKYAHDDRINDALSAISDVRVVWGGDQTILNLRKSPIGTRSSEIAFADRYSLAVIDADAYLEQENKKAIANDFYNDTYLTDQNACTSPRIVVWKGTQIAEAKEQFWKEVHELVSEKYQLQGVQAVNKLSNSYLLAAKRDHIKKIQGENNLVVRVQVQQLDPELLNYKDNSGYFFEYDCSDILELRDVCDDVRCQTISYIGEKEMLRPLIRSGVKGIDRVVPMGRTMDFDLIWDGYNLYERLTRNIAWF